MKIKISIGRQGIIYHAKVRDYLWWNQCTSMEHVLVFIGKMKREQDELDNKVS